MGKGVLPRVLAVVAEVSVRRALLHPHQVQMVQEAEAAAVRLLASALWVVAVVGAAVRCQVVRVVLACTHVMAVLGLLVVAVFPLQTLLLLEEQVAHVSGRHQELLAVQAACQVLLALLALRLLLVDYLGKVAAAAAVVLLARAVRAVLEVAALVAVAVVQHAVHMPLARAA